MNYATSLARHDWVLCVDSDEILDDEVVAAILALKAGDEPDPACAWRLPRYWFVLGEEVRTIIRYHRRISRFACLIAPSPGSTIGR